MASRNSARFHTKDNSRAYIPRSIKEEGDTDTVSRNSIGQLAAASSGLKSNVSTGDLTSGARSNRRNFDNSRSERSTKKEAESLQPVQSRLPTSRKLSVAETAAITDKNYSRRASNPGFGSKDRSIENVPNAESIARRASINAVRSKKDSGATSESTKEMEQDKTTRSRTSKRPVIPASQIPPLGNALPYKSVSSAHQSRRNSNAIVAPKESPATVSPSANEVVKDAPHFINPFAESTQLANQHSDVWSAPDQPEDAWKSNLPSIHPADSASQISDESPSKDSSAPRQVMSSEIKQPLSTRSTPRKQPTLQSSTNRPSRAADTTMIVRRSTRSIPAPNTVSSGDDKRGSLRGGTDVVIVESPRNVSTRSRTSSVQNNIERGSSRIVERAVVLSSAKTKRHSYHDSGMSDRLTSPGNFQRSDEGYLRNAPLVTITVTRSRKIPPIEREVTVVPG